MTTLKLSGYLAAAQTVAWTGATQKIDSLADNEWTDLSDEIDNSSNKYAFADLDLVLGSAAFTGSDAGIEVYIVPTVDGTNYPNFDTTFANYMLQYYVGQILVKAVSAAAFRGALRGVVIPPGKYKWALRNVAGAAAPSSGNTLGERNYSNAYT